MTDRVARVRELMLDIAEYKKALKECEEERNALLAELIGEGLLDLGDGYKAVRSERYDIEVSKARELVPAIYDNMVQHMREVYVPEPTKADLEKAIAHLPVEQREAILQHINLGDPKVVYFIRRG